MIASYPTSLARPPSTHAGRINPVAKLQENATGKGVVCASEKAGG